MCVFALPPVLAAPVHVQRLFSGPHLYPLTTPPPSLQSPGAKAKASAAAVHPAEIEPLETTALQTPGKGAAPPSGRSGGGGGGGAGTHRSSPGSARSTRSDLSGFSAATPGRSRADAAGALASPGVEESKGDQTDGAGSDEEEFYETPRTSQLRMIERKAEVQRGLLQQLRLRQARDMVHQEEERQREYVWGGVSGGCVEWRHFRTCVLSVALPLCVDSGSRRKSA